ncbi:MAG: transposase, partial [Bacillota bacterium]|nr:transposase [Bacillota bacterium]
MTNNNLYQPKLLYNFKICYDLDIPQNDISRTVAEVVEGVDVLDYVDFSNRNSYGYDGLLMFEALILAMAIYGYASTRNLESLCKFDIRFKFIMRGETPSHMAFQRFINNDLKKPIEDIFYEINRYIENKDKDLNTDILYIDGSKFEANANKMTFVWKKSTIKYRSRIWETVNKNIFRMNKYFLENNIRTQFSILKAPNLDYLMEICIQIEKI